MASSTIDVDSAATEGLSDNQLKAQQEQLKAGQKGGEAKDGPTVAHNRAEVDEGPVNGQVDQMTRQTMRDALQGHFCVVDRTHKGVNTDLLPEGEDGYGVFESVVSVDKNNYPETINVRLSGNQMVTVPYTACHLVEPRRR